MTNPYWPTVAPDMFGGLISAGDVRDAAETTLQTWLATYVAEMSVRKAVDLPAVDTWEVLPEYRTLAVGQTACMVVCGGTVKAPERRGDGTVRAVWDIEVSLLLDGDDWLTTERQVGWYGTCVTAALTQHRDLGGVASGVTWAGYRYAVASHAATRTLGVGRLSFLVSTDLTLNVDAGPHQLTAPITDAPTVATVAVTVTGGSP